MNKEDLKESMSEETKEIQQKLLWERHKRIIVMSYLLSALLFTVVFGTIQNPFQYTFSKIGNRFDPNLRILFIVWASYTGFAIQSSILALFQLEGYKKKLHYVYIITAVVFLVFTALAPSQEYYPFWTWIHLVTGLMFALFITLGFLPFVRWVARENPRLRRVVYVWLSITWGGSFTFAFIYGNTGVFELFFFCTFIIFLLYLSLTLFEEQIIKRSVRLLKGYEDINEGLEFIFFNNLFKKDKSKSNKTKKSE